jgi:hypothetical protein
MMLLALVRNNLSLSLFSPSDHIQFVRPTKLVLFVTCEAHVFCSLKSFVHLWVCKANEWLFFSFKQIVGLRQVLLVVVVALFELLFFKYLPCVFRRNWVVFHCQLLHLLRNLEFVDVE